LLSILVLVAVVQLLNRTRSIWLCTCLYGGAGVLFDLFEELTVFERAVSVVLNIGVAYLLFYLLLRFEDNRALWWTILIGFASIPVVLAFAGA
jgi:hypothetical protein